MEPCVLPDWVAGTFIIGRKDRVNHLWLENLHKCTFAQLFASLPAWMNAHKHGNRSTRMRCFHGYSWKQNKNAYTNVWGKQIKEGCHPSILQIHGSSKKNEYSLVFSKRCCEVLAPPLFVIKEITMQTLYSNAFAKVLFVKEKMFYHFNIRGDLPWRLYPL